MGQDFHVSAPPSFVTEFSNKLEGFNIKLVAVVEAGSGSFPNIDRKKALKKEEIERIESLIKHGCNHEGILTFYQILSLHCMFTRDIDFIKFTSELYLKSTLI